MFLLLYFSAAGAPVVAEDQSALSSAAQRNMANQKGRQFGDGDALEEVQLSAEALNLQAILKNMFGDDLPEDLPSWDLLCTMSVTDCMSVVKAKIDRVKEVAGECSDVDAFQKATTPIVYDTTQVDDRLTKIHSASLLRAPLSEPTVWWNLMSKKHTPVSFIKLVCGSLLNLSHFRLSHSCRRVQWEWIAASRIWP